MNAIFSCPFPSCSRAPNFMLTFELHMGVLSPLICSSYLPSFSYLPMATCSWWTEYKATLAFPTPLRCGAFSRTNHSALTASAVMSVPCLFLLPSTLNFSSVRGDLKKTSPRSLLTTIWDQCTHPLPMTSPAAPSTPVTYATMQLSCVSTMGV